MTCFLEKHFSQMAAFYLKYLADLSLPWNVKIGVLEGFECFVETSKPNLFSWKRPLVEALFTCMGDGKYSIVRENSVTATKALLAKMPLDTDAKSWLIGRLNELAEKEGTPNIASNILALTPK